MDLFSVDILQIRDTHYAIGAETGGKLKNKPVLTAFQQLASTYIDLAEMKSIYSCYAPHLLEEMEGLSEGLNIPLKEAYTLFSGYDMNKPHGMGCSAYMDRQAYTRNYDFSPLVYDGILSLLQNPATITGIGYNLQGIGRHDGVNNCGLAIGLHFVSHEGYTKGLTAWHAVRMVLDTCSDANQAIDLLKELPHSACYNFSIADKKGCMAIVEASPGKIELKMGEEYLACFNAFESENLLQLNRGGMASSQLRRTFIGSLDRCSLDANDLFRLFTERKSPLFFTDYEQMFGTLHTMAYEFESSRFRTKLAGGQDCLDFSLEEWANGVDLTETELTGFIRKEESLDH
ncbi:C45 family autoproteolytic acyltransferase/hydolase [Bacillus sp. 1P06AnD]|uniref:C45 family autoproteolytic acyltransferase/hydolase n=1 Tax=Bacillus sp. 1P06AnD TaxID=3132208 RepID=UPI00399FB7AD